MPEPVIPGRARLTAAALIAILLLALLLRTYGLRELVYANPDDAHLAYFVVRVAQLSPLATDPQQNSLANLLSWDYGYPVFLVNHLYLKALQSLGLPIHESTLPLHLVVFGLLNCVLMFCLAQRLGGPRAGLLAALLYAVMPLIVGRTRSLGGLEAATGFLLLLAALQLIRYLEEPTARRRWVAGLCLGLYLSGDVQFLVGGAVLLALTLLWPRPEGYTGAGGWRRLILTSGLLIPPLILFSPYLPAYAYAVHLGYPDQTYLGTVLNEHQADWGFHLIPFLRDLARNMGVLPLLALPLIPLALGHLGRDGRLRWLLCWAGLTAFPFLFFVSGKTTEASGYHHHLVASLTLLLAWAYAALKPRESGTSLGILVALGALLITLGGVLQIPSLRPLWPDTKIPYGGVVPNNGMKTAGYWVRRNIPLADGVFVAQDPTLTHWYLGRAGIIGGYGAGMERAPSFLKVKDRVQWAVVPGQREEYPPQLFADNGFPGHLTVTSGGEVVLDLYSRRPLSLTLRTEETDREFDRTYRTLRDWVDPTGPYVPGKDIAAKR